jgi:hypothetical protein
MHAHARAHTYTHTYSHTVFSGLEDVPSHKMQKDSSKKFHICVMFQSLCLFILSLHQAVARAKSLMTRVMTHLLTSVMIIFETQKFHFLLVHYYTFLPLYLGQVILQYLYQNNIILIQILQNDLTLSSPFTYHFLC